MLHYGPPQPEETPFAVTLCGAIRVLAEEPNWTRIAQFHAGVELLGWRDQPIDIVRGPIRCKLRYVVKKGRELVMSSGTTSADRFVVESVPAGFQKPELTGNDRVAERMNKEQSVYWLIQ